MESLGGYYQLINQFKPIKCPKIVTNAHFTSPEPKQIQFTGTYVSVPHFCEAESSMFGDFG